MAASLRNSHWPTSLLLLLRAFRANPPDSSRAIGLHPSRVQATFEHLGAAALPHWRQLPGGAEFIGGRDGSAVHANGSRGRFGQAHNVASAILGLSRHIGPNRSDFESDRTSRHAIETRQGKPTLGSAARHYFAIQRHTPPMRKGSPTPSHLSRSLTQV